MGHSFFMEILQRIKRFLTSRRTVIALIALLIVTVALASFSRHEGGDGNDPFLLARLVPDNLLSSSWV